jgi:hypothetical protein
VSPTTKRVLAVVVVIFLLLCAGAGFYLYRASRPLRAPVPVAPESKPPDIFSLIPPDAPAVVYLDANALRTTQNSSLDALGALLLPTPQQDPDYTAFVKGTGFDYSRDLERAVIAVWPSDFGAAANQAGDNPTLAIADGRFDQDRIKLYALRTGHVVTRGPQTIYEVPGQPLISFEFLSATRVAMASGKNATNQLTGSAHASRGAASQSLVDRVAGAPLFAVVRASRLPESIFASFQNSPQLLALARSIQALTLAGQPQGNNLNLTLDAQCDSMKDALAIGTLLDGFRMIGAVALSDPKQRGTLTKQQATFLSTLLAKVNVAPHENWVRLSIALTPQMLAGATSSH